MLKTSSLSILLGIYSLLLTSDVSNAVVELGQVKCVLTINYTKEFHDAEESCYTKQEHKIEEHHKANPYPVNATIEEFEWDDLCVAHCLYETVGIMGKDETLPDPKNTEQIFGKTDKVSNKLYEVVISVWNNCLELSETVAKKKGFDKCKAVIHHRHCFQEKMWKERDNIEIPC